MSYPLTGRVCIGDSVAGSESDERAAEVPIISWNPPAAYGLTQLPSFRDAPSVGNCRPEAQARNPTPGRGYGFRVRSFPLAPRNDEKRLGRTPALSVLLLGRRQVPPEFGWIATISKPRFRASVRHQAHEMEPGDWSQP